MAYAYSLELLWTGLLLGSRLISRLPLQHGQALALRGQHRPFVAGYPETPRIVTMSGRRTRDSRRGRSTSTPASAALHRGRRSRLPSPILAAPDWFAAAAESGTSSRHQPA